jgi:hypothetical protein
MNKSRLMLSSLCLAAVLALTAPTTTVYADSDGPQGGSNSTKGGPPPPPPPSLPTGTINMWVILSWML